jgi:prephenate dehydratase
MIRVAIQGINGSYSEEAAHLLLGADASIVECRDFETTFDAVRRGEAEGAVVPVENKIVGRIGQSTDLLEAGGFRVLDKLPLKVLHVLAGTADAKIEKLVSVRSHVEALKQCRRFLTSHPQLKQVIGADTASSIRRIVEEGHPAKAAIGSRRAAELYGATILAEGIADDEDNWTTFYLIGN